MPLCEHYLDVPCIFLTATLPFLEYYYLFPPMHKLSLFYKKRLQFARYFGLNLQKIHRPFHQLANCHSAICSHCHYVFDISICHYEEFCDNHHLYICTSHWTDFSLRFKFLAMQNTNHASCSLGFRMLLVFPISKTSFPMVVDNAAGLQMGIDRDRTHIFQPSLFQIGTDPVRQTIPG